MLGCFSVHGGLYLLAEMGKMLLLGLWRCVHGLWFSCPDHGRAQEIPHCWFTLQSFLTPPGLGAKSEWEISE